jgi:glycosyltransferase involved in cell wall biosynthesis
MENQPLLSVIMPVYNAEQYLNHSVSDVLNQTFRNLELILVNDGSQDNSAQLCQSFASEDKRVVFLNFDENRGVCAVRNDAIKQTRGKYLTFMDADDRLHRNAYQTVIDSIGEFHPQVAVFGAQEIYTDRNGAVRSTQTRTLPQHFFQDRESLRCYVITLETSTLYGYLWNKFYDAEYLKDNRIYMKDYKIASDFFYNRDYFMDIETMAVLDFAPYHYYRRLETGLTSGYFLDFFSTQEERVDAVLQQYRQWGLYSDDIKDKMAKLYVRYVFAAVQRLFDPRAQLSPQDRTQWMGQLYHSDLYTQLIPISQDEKSVYRRMSRLLEKQKTKKILLSGHLLYLLKKYMPFLFNRIKNR